MHLLYIDAVANIAPCMHRIMIELKSDPDEQALYGVDIQSDQENLIHKLAIFNSTAAASLKNLSNIISYTQYYTMT